MSQTNTPVPTSAPTVSSRVSSRRSQAANTILLGVTMFVAAAGYGQYRLGSLRAMIDYTNGKRVLVDAADCVLPEVTPGKDATAAYSITNMTGSPLTLLGAETSCGCAVVDDLPMIIPDGERRLVSLTVQTFEPGEIVGRLVLFTDDEAQARIHLRYAGSVRVIGAPGISDRQKD